MWYYYYPQFMKVYIKAERDQIAHPDQWQRGDLNLGISIIPKSPLLICFVLFYKTEGEVEGGRGDTGR